MSTLTGPSTLRRLDTASASDLAGLCSIHDDLQTTLSCCEWLVHELGRDATDPPAPGTEAVVEGVWTLALTSYARAFATSGRGSDPLLTDADITVAAQPSEALDWHVMLLRLRDHHVDPVVNPRQQFTVAVAQGRDGLAEGVAITSATQPHVDEFTVRQTGAVAFALCALVDSRISALQADLLTDLAEVSPEDLAAMELVNVEGQAQS